MKAYEKSFKLQLSVMEINEPNISKYGVILKSKETNDLIIIFEIQKFRMHRLMLQVLADIF